MKAFEFKKKKQRNYFFLEPRSRHTVANKNIILIENFSKIDKQFSLVFIYFFF